MKLTFHGAAQTTTGSMHFLELNGKRILLDCGLYQGNRKKAFEKNRHLPVDPASLDMVLLSHAHIDHSGNLPTLVKNGFTGKIITTNATRDLCDIMLRDSAHIQEKDVEYANKKRIRQGKTPFEPLYVPADIDPTMQVFRGVDYEQPVDIAPNAQATFHDAGHILGSALITIDFSENGIKKRLLFTGDMGRKNMPILNAPTVVHDVDYMITESTYGNRLHPPKADVMGRLKGFVDDICSQHARLIIPSFSVGRTQQIVYFFHELHDAGRIKDIPIFVDSPLSTKATAIYDKHKECYDSARFEHFIEGNKPFQFKGLQYVTETEDSKLLNQQQGPVIIISSSGMCEGGRIVHHLKNNIEDPRNIILFIGYQAENTLGRKIVEHQSPVKIFSGRYNVEARVHTINALSAHADIAEMTGYFKEMGPEVEKAFVVHGELPASESMAEALKELGAKDIFIPEPEESFEI